MQRRSLFFMLFAIVLFGATAADDAKAACGGDGELVCVTSGCDSGHRRYLTRCWDVESEGFPSYCGGTGEPACDIAQQLAWNLGKACKSGRREFAGTCYALEGGYPTFCGGTNEPACSLAWQIGWGISSCKTGRVEDPGIPLGTCRAIDADGWPATCGGTNEPACEVDIIAALLAKTGKLIGACKSDLIQQGSPTSATCVPFDEDGFPPFCGDIGERACALTEHIPSCKRGAVEHFGIPVGDCVADAAFLGMTDFTRPAPSPWPEAEEPPGPRTVVYIHGKGGQINSDSHELLMTALAAAGHTIYGADYNAGIQDSDTSFELVSFEYDETAGIWAFAESGTGYGRDLDGTNFYLQEVAGSIAEAIDYLAGAPNVTIIAGSMGGLVARHLVYRHYDELRFAGHRITEVITLGSPHSGGGFGIAGVTGPSGVAGYVVQERFGCTGRFEPFLSDKELRHRYQTCLIEKWQAGREAVDVPIDDTDYPQIYWATIAGTGQLLTGIDQSEDFTPLESDSVVATRSAFGIAQDDCYPHDTEAGPRVEHDVKTVDGEDAWGATCHHPEYLGLGNTGYVRAYALNNTDHDFSEKIGDVKPGGDAVYEAVAEYVEFQLTAAPDVDGDSVADDWERYFLTPPDNCRLTPNPGQADNNANGFGDACDGDYNGDGVVGVPDFILFIQVYGALAADANYNALYDADGDGEIGPSDLEMLIGSIGRPPGE